MNPRVILADTVIRLRKCKSEVSDFLSALRSAQTGGAIEEIKKAITPPSESTLAELKNSLKLLEERLDRVNKIAVKRAMTWD